MRLGFVLLISLTLAGPAYAECNRKCAAGTPRDPDGCCIVKKKAKRKKRPKKKACLPGQVKNEAMRQNDAGRPRDG